MRHIFRATTPYGRHGFDGTAQVRRVLSVRLDAAWPIDDLRAKGVEAAPDGESVKRDPLSVLKRAQESKETQGQRQMDLIELARESGMAVLLDARIGREEYVSVSGSLAALKRFAEAV